jgi:hypothetical protein
MDRSLDDAVAVDVVGDGVEVAAGLRPGRDTAAGQHAPLCATADDILLTSGQRGARRILLADFVIVQYADDVDRMTQTNMTLGRFRTPHPSN